MKKNIDSRIDTYIAKSAPFAQPVLRHLRDLIHRACPEVEETMKWGFPHFLHQGILCSMAAFKEHCALGFWHHGIRADIVQAAGKAEDAMGQFGRIASLADLPDERTMLRLLRRAVKLNESGTPARPQRAAKPRPASVVPDDLATALGRNQAAAATFEKFSPSHRHEYIEWLTEAKRDETRRKRLATTIEWLAAGKSRNWKYLNC